MTVVLQANEIKSLKSELEQLHKSKLKQKIQLEQDRQSFQWLVEQISDDESVKDIPAFAGKKRKRPIGRKQAGGAWISDAEFEDDNEDDDAALTDDLVSATRICDKARQSFVPTTVFPFHI